MSVLGRPDVIHALDQLIERMDGIAFQRLARRLAEHVHPGSTPHAERGDLGRDATLTIEGRSAVLLASLTATWTKLSADVRKAQASTGPFEIAVFCTPKRVENAEIERWRRQLADVAGQLELRVWERTWVVDRCLDEANAWIVFDELGLKPATLAPVYVWAEADVRAGLDPGDGDPGTAIEPQDVVDVFALRNGLVPGLQRQFAELAGVFDGWVDAAQIKRGPERIRALWIVGDARAHRGKALLACLARAGARRPVCDAGRDLGALAESVAWCVRNPPTSSAPLFAVDLDGEEPASGWTEVRNHVLQARRRPRPEGAQPLLIAGGTAEQAQAAADALGALVELTAVDARGRSAGRAIGATPIAAPSERVFNQGLPMTARKLFGRTKDLSLLREAWDADATRVVSIVAFGGIGKSALVNTWLRELASEDYPGADRVLAWSFYSQGTKDNLVSADQFVDFALRWLGDERAMSLSPWARGRRLASLIKAHRFLLVLDGLEPLQHPPDAPEVGGRLTDDSIRALLEELAEDDWHGLCVVTTRVALADLEPYEPRGPQHSGAVVQRRLPQLDEGAAIALLQHLIGREADHRELRLTVEEVHGHALAITLLGHYLRDVHGGDLAGRVDLEELVVAAEEGGHARRVMATYARWLAEHGRLAELGLLHLIGLFDRPAEPRALDALVAAAELRPLVANLDGVGGTVWNGAVQALQRMGLLNEDAPGMPGTLDAHPLVREHFRDRLRSEHEAMWIAGNRALFEHYRTTAAPQPADAAGMQPLYAAVTHGSAAGLHQEVYDEVLLPRIWRGRRTSFSTRRLGLTGADLVALSNFFQHRRWAQLRELPLTPRAQVLVRTNAGVRLRQLGRLVDARQCFGAVVGAIDPETAGPEELEDASYAAAQNCELLVIAGRLAGVEGDVDTALVSGQRAVEYADRGADAYFAMHARSSLAEVHFMLGDVAAAGACFDEAMEIERERKPRPGFLYSQGLYRYGYYLIETGRAREILEGERSGPEWGTNGDDSSLLSVAIKLLICGAARRASMERGDGPMPALASEAAQLLDDAISELRTAGYPDYVVRGLLERARFHAVRGEADDYGRAQADLARATMETRRGAMDLLQADVTLERIDCELRFWCSMTNAQRATARSRLTELLADAAGRVEAFGYGRRAAMLERLRAQAAALAVADA